MMTEPQSEALAAWKAAQEALRKAKDDEREARQAYYRSVREEWHCPYCGTLLSEAEGGMECPVHGIWTWGQLRGESEAGA